MSRKRPDVQPCGERHEPYLHCLTCHPIPPERPEKLQGPEIGALMRYRKAGHYRVDRVVRVVERSYVWAPGDPSYHGGSRRYDWKVVDFGDTKMVVDDVDLHPIELGDTVVPAERCAECHRPLGAQVYVTDTGKLCSRCGFALATR